MLLRVIIISLVFTQVDARGCAPRWYPGKDSPVCVCNCTYCDTVEPIGQVGDQDVIVYTTTKDGKRLERSVKKKAGLPSLNIPTPLLNLSLSVDPGTTFQTINGFGGTMTDMAAYNIISLQNASCSGGSSSSTMRDVLMKAYFSPDGGLEYNMMRLPIASNDASNRTYTYADTKDDFELNYFSLQHEDIDLKIPCIKQAQSLAAAGTTIRILCSSWSAPAWMKRCECLSGKDIIKEVPYGRMLKGDPGPATNPNSTYYETWAKYFVKFLQAYKQHNITIWAITTQNEPESSIFVPWQSQVYFAQTQRDFLKYNLGPAVRNAGLDTKIFIFDDSRFPNLPAWVAQVCNDSDARRYVDGVALHWFMDAYTPAELLDAARAECGASVEILYTEANYFADFVLYVFAGLTPPSGVPTYGTWQIAPDHAKAIVSDLNHWSTGWIDWNLATDINGGPQWLNKGESAVIVNASAGEFYKQPLYYVLGHFSKFIPRGSKRIGLTFKDISNPLAIPAVAFLRPDGLKVVVAVNDQNRDLVASIAVVAGQLLGQTIPLDLPGNSIVTIVFR